MALKPIIASCLIAFALFGCKVGEDDPAFTFLTRANRLDGGWVVTSYEYSGLDSTATLSGDSLISMNKDSVRFSRPFQWTFSFERAGLFESILTQQKDLATQPVVETTTGDWEFAGGQASKNKSKLALYETEYRESSGVEGSNIFIYSISGDAMPDVFEIKELRNDKVVLTQSTEVADPFTSRTTSVNITLEPLEE
jgi:hypothetical protein